MRCRISTYWSPLARTASVSPPGFALADSLATSSTKLASESLTMSLRTKPWKTLICSAKSHVAKSMHLIYRSWSQRSLKRWAKAARQISAMTASSSVASWWQRVSRCSASWKTWRSRRRDTTQVALSQEVKLTMIWRMAFDSDPCSTYLPTGATSLIQKSRYRTLQISSFERINISNEGKAKLQRPY